VLKRKNDFLALFCPFAIIKKLSPEILTVHIILILDTVFVTNLKFSGHLSPDISFGEKTVIQPGGPSLFAIHALRNNSLTFSVVLFAAGLLTQDPRIRERQKPGQYGPRRKYTWYVVLVSEVSMFNDNIMFRFRLF